MGLNRFLKDHFIYLFALLTIVKSSTCVYGQYEDVNGDCQLCSVIIGCLNCTSESSCKFCAEGFYIDSSELCAQCPIGCEGCFSDTFCTSCESGYYIQSDNTCQPCGSNCQTCSAETTCLTCPGGMVLQMGACISCNIDNCVYCIQNTTQSIQCAECALGYYLDISGTCQSCSLVGCASCNASDLCLSCQLGYYLDDDNQCKQCGQLCSQCTTSADQCDSCVLGYYLTSPGVCESCSNQEGCLICENGTDCLACHKGFYIDSITYDCTACIIDNCYSCQSDVLCTDCNYGFVLTNSGTSCDECSSQTGMQGCLNCQSPTICTVCELGFYLENDKCQRCPKGCSDCQNGTYCDSCTGQFVWEDGSCHNCQNNTIGCSFCADNGSCLICQPNYFINNTDDLCYSCRDEIQGCRICDNSATCEICSQGYWKDTANGDICKLCSTSLQGCVYCSDENVCLGCSGGYYLAALDTQCTACNDGNQGCQLCDSVGLCLECQSGYYLDTDDGNKCKLCKDLNEGCIFCSYQNNCTQCQGGYSLDLSTFQCVQCNISGCEICRQDDATKCVTCNSLFYMGANDECLLCSDDLPGCLICTDSTTCSVCQSGYFQDSGDCLLCSEAHTGCNKCSDSSTCTLCQGMFYLDTNNQCQSCEQKITGCAQCKDQDQCISCLSGFYLQNDQCVACTEILGCTFCSSQTICLSCDKGFYLQSNQCHNCSEAIGGCLSCFSGSQCIKCQGGFSLTEDSLCQTATVAVSEQSSQQQSVKFRTKYISNQTLVHYLLAVEFNLNTNLKLDKIDWNSNAKIRARISNGTIITLKIKNAEWYDEKTIIFYTDNPLNFQEEDLEKMPFARRRLQSTMSTSIHTSIQLSETVTKQLMPDYNHVGPLNIEYSLDDPQFYTSYLKVASQSLLWIIGMVVTVVVLIKYSVKACYTVPNSLNLGHIIPHIFALKAGALILYPTYIEYINYCTGFMTADLPWLNQIFGPIFGDEADNTPLPFKVFYTNMNIGSTYFSAFITILVLGLILFAIAKFAKKQQRIYPYFQVMYSFFSFGVVFAGCIAFQGAILNPIQSLTLNGFLYILGIALYFITLIQVCFSLKVKGKQSFWKVRVFLKATILSLSHLSPVYLIASTLFIDLILIVVEYKLCIYSQIFQKSWISANICINIALVLVVFSPTVIVSLLFVSLFVLVAIILQGYMHYMEMKGQVKQRQSGNAISNKIQETQQNIWQLNMTKNSTNDSKIFNIYNNDSDMIDQKFNIEIKQQKKIAKSSSSGDSQKDYVNQQAIKQIESIVSAPKIKSKSEHLRSKMKQKKLSKIQKTKVSPKKIDNQKEQVVQLEQQQQNQSFVFQEDI